MTELAVAAETTSDDQAMAVLIVQEFQDAFKDSYLGRTAIQKLCYFAKAVGIPLSYNYRIYYYGPYSEELVSDCDQLLSDRVLVDTSPDQYRYSNLRAGPNAATVLAEHPELVRRYQPTVESVVAAFGQLDPSKLELLSTLHFVDQRLKAGGASSPSRREVVQAFKSVKGGKFADADITNGYDALQRIGLLG